jgi:hypothetical protein
MTEQHKTEETTWPKCQHPRTIENTVGLSARNQRGQCRTCWRVAFTRYARSEKGQAKIARYNAAHQEDRKAYAAAYRAANLDKIKARAAKWYAEHREQIAAKYQTNKAHRAAEAVAVAD